MVFETVGIVWGYIFVIVIAGCSLIIGYYKGKGLIKLPLGSGKTKQDSESTEEKTSTETEWGVPPKDDGEKKD